MLSYNTLPHYLMFKLHHYLTIITTFTHFLHMDKFKVFESDIINTLAYVKMTPFFQKPVL